MIGRAEELRRLEQMYQSGRFEFLIMYGRRRIGKTTILQEFAKKHLCVFFSAQEKNDALNLQDFSRVAQSALDQEFLADFRDWEQAFDYVGKRAEKERIVLIMDEFPFLAGPNPSVKSILQHTIDHKWKDRNLFLILCGSSVSFMVNEVMGYESPLYGRNTGTMEVKPFDYYESRDFFPEYDAQTCLIAYGILGGVPRYLNAFDSQKSLDDNIRDAILDTGAFLHEEPLTLLRMELREPVVYNSILEAVSNGCVRITEISGRIHEEKGKCSKYMMTLQSIGLVRKKVPCGETETGKKGIYQIADFFYRFWYRYVFSNRNYYALLGADGACGEIMGEINDYMGPIFEEICEQYLVRMARNGNLPFIPYQIGKWWGTNPVMKKQDDVDILALDKKAENAIFVECKFRNRPMPMEEYDDLVMAAACFPYLKKRYWMFISKGGYTEPVKRRAAEEGAVLLTVDDLFRLSPVFPA